MALDDVLSKRGGGDPFCTYLHGLVLADRYSLCSVCLVPALTQLSCHGVTARWSTVKRGPRCGLRHLTQANSAGMHHLPCSETCQPAVAASRCRAALQLLHLSQLPLPYRGLEGPAALGHSRARGCPDLRCCCRGKQEQTATQLLHSVTAVPCHLGAWKPSGCVSQHTLLLTAFPHRCCCRGKREEAATQLLHSVTAFSCHLGAWEALQRLCLPAAYPSTPPTGTPGPSGQPQELSRTAQRLTPQQWLEVCILCSVACCTPQHTSCGPSRAVGPRSSIRQRSNSPRSSGVRCSCRAVELAAHHCTSPEATGEAALPFCPTAELGWRQV